MPTYVVSKQTDNGDLFWTGTSWDDYCFCARFLSEDAAKSVAETLMVTTDLDKLTVHKNYNEIEGEDQQVIHIHKHIVFNEARLRRIVSETHGFDMWEVIPKVE